MRLPRVVVRGCACPAGECLPGPVSRRLHGSGMETAWRLHGACMTIPWRLHGARVAVAWRQHTPPPGCLACSQQPRDPGLDDSWACCAAILRHPRLRAYLLRYRRWGGHNITAASNIVFSNGEYDPCASGRVVGAGRRCA